MPRVDSNISNTASNVSSLLFIDLVGDLGLLTITVHGVCFHRLLLTGNIFLSIDVVMGIAGGICSVYSLKVLLIHFTLHWLWNDYNILF